MEIALTLTVGGLCILCFLVGAKVGQKVSKGEPIEIPSVNPMETLREHNAKKEAKYEQSRIDTILRNVEAYDGTASGQIDVPRR